VFGFSSWNFEDVHRHVNVCGPITSNELRTVWIFGSLSCSNWNGGTLNTALMSALPPSSAIVDAGGDIDTMIRASFAELASPHSLAAAICRVTACTDTLIAGSAMRSLSVKSAIVLIAGLRALRKNGCADSAEMPLTAREVFAVLAHRVMSPGTPPDTRST